MEAVRINLGGEKYSSLEFDAYGQFVFLLHVICVGMFYILMKVFIVSLHYFMKFLLFT